MKVVTAHQPAFLPWIGLLHKIMLSDIFIFMDIAKFRKRAFMHRNKIEINKNSHYIGLKLSDDSDAQYCHEVSISSFHKKNLEEIYNKIILTYKKYENFKDLDFFLTKAFNENKNYLNDICLTQLKVLCDVMELKIKIINESTIIDFEKSKNISASERLFFHAIKTSADVYITGINSIDYLDSTIFEKNKITHKVQNFNYNFFLKYQNCTEPLSVVHQIAKLGFYRLKEELLANQVNKNNFLQNAI